MSLTNNKSPTKKENRKDHIIEFVDIIHILGVCITLLVLSKDLFSLGIPKSTTSQQINDNESHKSDDQNDVCLEPLCLEICKQSSFAGTA